MGTIFMAQHFSWSWKFKTFFKHLIYSSLVHVQRSSYNIANLWLSFDPIQEEMFIVAWLSTLSTAGKWWKQHTTHPVPCSRGAVGDVSCHDGGPCGTRRPGHSCYHRNIRYHAVQDWIRYKNIWHLNIWTWSISQCACSRPTLTK